MHFSGVIYIFMFFNAKEERTRYKNMLYYGLWKYCIINVAHP